MTGAARRNAKPKESGRWLALLVVIAAIVAAGLWLWKSTVFVGSGRLALVRTSFQSLPGWNQNDARPALEAFGRSCAVLRRAAASRAMNGAGYAGSVGDWQPLCAALPTGEIRPESARQYFESWFDPVSVKPSGDSKALFTGYYEPEIRASPKRRGRFSTPVYGLPSDLVTADLGLFSVDLAGKRLEGRLQGRSLVPYFTRAEIDRNGLATAPVLLWADDPVGVFFLHIQGSGRARLDNGALVRLTYAGQNGRSYTPVGRVLIEQGAVDRDQMSMQAIRSWMRTHGSEARRVMESDQSFVFFREAPLGDPSLGSPGSEGVPLTPGASIAVDARLHPLGAPFFISATVPDADPSGPERPVNRLFVAQDTGGAIKGSARADVFWGFGADAESIAGRMKSNGRLYVLLPKQVARRLPAEYWLQ